MKGEIIKRVIYIAEQTSKLSEKIIGQTFPISSLTIFSHSETEFESLKESLGSLGSPYNENNGPRVTLYEPIKAGHNLITHLRIRKPDPERPQVGCNDFQIDDYESFKNKYQLKYPHNLKIIVRPEYEMIEFADPDFEVLAYVISK
jgi:hypothetical protein